MLNESRAGDTKLVGKRLRTPFSLVSGSYGREGLMEGAKDLVKFLTSTPLKNIAGVTCFFAILQIYCTSSTWFCSRSVTQS